MNTYSAAAVHTGGNARRERGKRSFPIKPTPCLPLTSSLPGRNTRRFHTLPRIERYLSKHYLKGILQNTTKGEEKPCIPRLGLSDCSCS